MPPKRRTKKAAYGVKRYNTSNRGKGRSYFIRSAKRKMGGCFVPAGYRVSYQQPDQTDYVPAFSRAGIGYGRRDSPITNDRFTQEMRDALRRARQYHLGDGFILREANRIRREIEEDNNDDEWGM